MVYGSVRMVIALVGHGRAFRGRGIPCARLACFVVASCASNNLLSDLAGQALKGLCSQRPQQLRVRSLRETASHINVEIMLRGF